MRVQDEGWHSYNGFEGWAEFDVFHGIVARSLYEQFTQLNLVTVCTTCQGESQLVHLSEYAES